MPKFKVGEKAIFNNPFGSLNLGENALVEIVEVRMIDWSNRLNGYYVRQVNSEGRTVFSQQNWLRKYPRKRKSLIYFNQLLNNL